MPRTKPWTVSDEFWEKAEPLVPEAPAHAKGGRPRMPERQAFEAMIYVLRTGICSGTRCPERWERVPRRMLAFRSGSKRVSLLDSLPLGDSALPQAVRSCLLAEALSPGFPGSSITKPPCLPVSFRLPPPRPRSCQASPAPGAGRI